jgi:uncharacterized membrane protein (DUF485 family)
MSIDDYQTRPASAGFFTPIGKAHMTQVTAPEAGSYAGAVVAIVASLTLTQWGIIVGIFTALATFFLNALYMHRRDQREQRESDARLGDLK